MNDIDIKELRKKLKMTQAEFARYMNVDNVTVSRWERKERRPQPVHRRKLERLSRKLNKNKEE